MRAAAERPDALALLTDALARENDARVREAIFTGLARLAKYEFPVRLNDATNLLSALFGGLVRSSITQRFAFRFKRS